MFGHQDDQMHQDGVQPAPDGALSTDNQGATTAPSVDEPAVGNDYIDAIANSAPAAPTTVEPTPAPASAEAVLPAEAAPAAQSAAAPNTDQLLDLKQQALQQLTPLVGHLEQDPEEKFRTTMMMIQASDNSSLIQTAYDAAMQIPNEKVRAQALLDIVNEINYFTHAGNNAE